MISFLGNNESIFLYIHKFVNFISSRYLGGQCETPTLLLPASIKSQELQMCVDKPILICCLQWYHISLSKARSP